MEYWKIFVGIGVIVFIFVFFLVFFQIKRKKKQNKVFRNKIQKFLEKIKNMPESHNNQKILEYDKILDKCLYEKVSGTKNLTTAKKMQKYEEYNSSGFHHSRKIWSAHRLRNKIAHEIGFQVSYTKFLEAEKIFIREILALIA